MLEELLPMLKFPAGTNTITMPSAGRVQVDPIPRVGKGRKVGVKVGNCVAVWVGRVVCVNVTVGVGVGVGASRAARSGKPQNAKASTTANPTSPMIQAGWILGILKLFSFSFAFSGAGSVDVSGNACRVEADAAGRSFAALSPGLTPMAFRITQKWLS